MGTASRCPALPGFGFLQLVPVHLSRWSFCAPLDALGGADLDRLAVASLLVPGLAPFRFRYLARLAQPFRLVGRAGLSHLWTDLSLSAYIELGAAATDQVGGLRHC